MAHVPEPTLTITCGIHFSRDELWVNARSTANPKAEDMQFGFLHLFTNFSCRNLVSITKASSAGALAAGLEEMRNSIEELETVGSYDQFRFADHPGKEGSFGRFEMFLQLVDGDYGPQGFQMLPAGFGFRTRKAEGHAHYAVIALAAWLVQSRASWKDDLFVPRLAEAAGLCGEEFRQGGYGIGTQHDRARYITMAAWTKGGRGPRMGE